MSTIIMSACWPLQGLTPAQKAVLISLADNANDEGVCWPSVAKIAERTCLSERAVQQAIKVLNECKALSIEARQGRSTMFTVTPAAFAPPQKVHPRRKCTPAGSAPTPADAAPQPPQEMHPTPAASAPRTVIEPTREPSGNLLPADSGQPDAERDRQQACRAIWSAYAAAYQHRYGTHPVRNSKVNGQVRDLLKRLGAEEAPAVAAYFVGINDAYLIRNCHDLGSLLAKAESYRTQWATDRQMNGTTARQLERTQANLNAAKEAAESIREEGRANAFL
ncbi:TPA: helix-turn-helix domain-containing protein [Pseudomonas aeruginosa]|uniref:helix-turn-helix domain-containing protein n=1 Tax=Pseudomonas aeruginosa TaxID=287 RepID=UPI0004F33BDA|nr:helix-turn-helix domain-containing protein [Pseudomonas aeruginosa]MED5134468.1 helix-turn-helix domain-containing protein [Pseudomonas aeruginosa]HBO2681553.1 helix-turn-helix domain-containing protein [Pseudomonas aeruginosa]HDY5054144.1 helix-turn-helix domain-containing protein [Pseudomonas aeruginosa]HEJ5664371.1 helix-turn-helix domain-containing protein [Pseudomonas aeruginosa]HEP8876767.1 helix-turn-helix domain-containing protein [Pseudomonas aeruginosa]